MATNSTYYNEHDPFAAAWLRELMADGLIPAGDVDERSIEDVTPNEIAAYNQCHFFAGIGGWPLALRLAGWPDDRPVWTGSAPCQPFSAAGKKGGFADERHLWPAFLWLISQQRPPVIFGEQVASKDGRDWFDVVSSDLEAHGYAVGAADLCAAGVGAPHIRQRLYFVADADRASSTRFGQHGGEGAPAKWLRGRFADSGKLGSLADADKSGCKCQPNIESEGVRRQMACPSGFWLESSDSCSSLFTLADTISAQEHKEQQRPTTNEGKRPSDGISGCGVDFWLGNPSGARLEERRRQPGDARPEQPPAERASVGGFWSDAIWLPCTDGKARATKPGLFPLAHGVSNRVGILRGAGNAIVPPLAAEFIGAYLEARE